MVETWDIGWVGWGCSIYRPASATHRSRYAGGIYNHCCFALFFKDICEGSVVHLLIRLQWGVVRKAQRQNHIPHQNCHNSRCLGTCLWFTISQNKWSLTPPGKHLMFPGNMCPTLWQGIHIHASGVVFRVNCLTPVTIACQCEDPGHKWTVSLEVSSDCKLTSTHLPL